MKPTSFQPLQNAGYTHTSIITRPSELSDTQARQNEYISASRGYDAPTLHSGAIIEDNSDKLMQRSADGKQYIDLSVGLVDTGHAASAGISLKTQEMYALVFVTRYLDLFTNFVSLYVLSLGTCLAVMQPPSNG